MRVVSNNTANSKGEEKVYRTVSLGSHFENFVNQKIQEGKFQNLDDLLRAALQLLEEEEQRDDELRSLILKGIFN